MTIDQFFPTQYQKEWEFLLQQMESRLLGSVSRSNFSGKQKWFNQITPTAATKILVRKGDTPDGEFAGTKYWLRQSPYEDVLVFDEWDQHFLGDIVLPKSETVRNQAMAFNRANDDTIIAAFDGTRYIGEDGVTADAFPGGQSIASTYAEIGAPGSSGLTVGKLRRAKYLMDLAEVPHSDRYFVHGAQQMQDLLTKTEVTSADYNNVRALVTGQVGTFLGFNFVDSQRLPIGTVAGVADVRSCFAYHGSAIKYSGVDRSTRMDILPMRRHALQIRSTEVMGAVRTQNELVVRIYCDETP